MGPVRYASPESGLGSFRSTLLFGRRFLFPAGGVHLNGSRSNGSVMDIPPEGAGMRGVLFLITKEGINKDPVSPFWGGSLPILGRVPSPKWGGFLRHQSPVPAAATAPSSLSA